jgi:hypothetical protein
VVVQQ